MRSLPASLALFSTLVESTFSHLAIQPRASTPLPPSKDEWYTEPPNFAASAPGTVFRTRVAPGNVTTVVANTSAAYNILYRTSDALYQPSWAVTTLLVPFSNLSRSSNTTSVLSYQIPYDSANVDASPSYAIYYDLAQSGLGIPATTDDFSAALGNGWFINIPDYEGPLAAFGASVQAGHATLDSVRAVLSSGLIPNPASTKYAMWGYSGGAIASEFAAELQVQYAPELSFSGMAAGGLVPNLTDLFDNINDTPYTGDLPSAILGSTVEYPDAYQWVLDHLNPTGPYNKSYFLSVLNTNAESAFSLFANQDVYAYFKNGKADIDVPIIQKIFNANGFMGYHGVPQMPVFAYKAVQDEFSLVKYTDELAQRWCGIGVDVWYQRNTVGGHIAEITNGRLRALEWLKGVFEGGYTGVGGCRVENVAVNLTSLSI